MDGSWNIGSIGTTGPQLRGPSSSRLIAEPPLSPPVSSGANPTASAQPLEPSAPLDSAPLPTFEPLAPPVSDGPTFGEPALKPPMSLESLLMRFRLITPEQLDQALREKTETGKDVGAIVVERGWVNEDQLSRLVSYAPAFSTETEDAVEAQPVQTFETQPVQTFETQPVQTFETQPEQTFETQPEQTFEAHAAPAVEIEAEPEAALEQQNLSEPEQVADEPPTFQFSTPSPLLPPALDLIEEPEAVAAEPTDSPEPVAEAEPLAEITPVFEPADEQPEPEAQAVSEPEPVQAEAAPEPVVEITEPVVETPELVVETVEVAAEPEPQVVKFVEPAPIETIARVFVRLSNGERVEAGSFDDIAVARTRAEEVVQQVSQSDNGWPFFGGRFIRPEAIVSVDVDATVVRYA